MSNLEYIFLGYTKNNKEYYLNMYLENNYLIIQTQNFNNSIKNDYFYKQNLFSLKNFNLFVQFNSLEDVFKYLKNIINIQKQNNIYSLIEEKDNKLILIIPFQKGKIKNIVFELKKISNYDNNNYNNENINTYNNYNQINNNNNFDPEQINNIKNEFENFKEKYKNDFQYLINEISALKNENQSIKNLLKNIQNEIILLKNNYNNNNNINQNIYNNNNNDYNNDYYDNKENYNNNDYNNNNDYYDNNDYNNNNNDFINDQYYNNNNNNYNKNNNKKNLIKKQTFDNSNSLLKSKINNHKQNNNNKISKIFSQSQNLSSSKLSFYKQKSYSSSISSPSNNQYLKYFPNTTIIKTKDEKIILSLLNSIISENSSFELLFKASKDGENIKIFHNKVDGKGPILFFIKTNYKNIRIGGFSSIPWSSDGKMKNDSNAFIFSIDRNKKYVLKNSKDNFAVIHAGYYSLCFGDDDLHIGEKCLSDEKCNYCGHCKTFIPLNNNTKYVTNLLGERGKKYFKVIDYEVYKVNI